MNEVTPDKEFARAAYDAHHSLFRHYSEQIFKTRISIITLILIFAGYLLGIVPLQSRPVDPIVSALLAFLSALLVVLLFSNEIAYYRRLTQVVQAGRILESNHGVNLYFSILDHVSHWRLYSIYVVAIALFVATALARFYQSALWNQYRILAVLILVPMGLMYWALLEFSRTAKIGLGLGALPMTDVTKPRRYFPLGAPWREDLYKEYETKIIDRFSEGDPKALTEKGVDYINRALDRQINKARGLLTYNALLVTAINTVVVAGTPPRAAPVLIYLIDIGRTLALTSCIPLLAIFYLTWGPATVFGKAETDFRGTFSTLRRRTYLLTVSIYITLLATLIALGLVLTRFY